MQITLLWLSIFDLQNVIDAKTVVTFREYVLLTSCLQCLHKQVIYHYFQENVSIAKMFFCVAMARCIPFLYSTSKV